MELFRTLDQATLGVPVITSSNHSSPWLAFEAGVLISGNERGKIIPFMVDVQPAQLSGPLHVFQGVSANKSGTLRLLIAVAEAHGITFDVDNHRRFESTWPEIEKVFDDAVQASRSLVHEPVPSYLQSLEGQLRDATSMLRELVRSTAMGPQPAGPPQEQRGLLMKKVEGAWLDNDASHAYAKIINNTLHIAYSFRGNSAITGVFYDWRPLGEDYWIGNFEWLLDPDSKGFAMFRMIDADTLEGRWWHSDEHPPLVDSPDIPSDVGLASTWRRNEDTSIPPWAEAYFATLE